MDENPYKAPVDKINAVPDDRTRARKRLLAWYSGLTIFAAQLLVCAVLRFGDIGFDQPGRYGLDFDDGLLLLAIQGGLLTLAVAIAIWSRLWNLLVPQVIIVLLTMACYG